MIRTQLNHHRKALFPSANEQPLSKNRSASARKVSNDAQPLHLSTNSEVILNYERRRPFIFVVVMQDTDYIENLRISSIYK